MTHKMDREEEDLVVYVWNIVNIDVCISPVQKIWKTNGLFLAQPVDYILIYILKTA